MRPIKMEVPIRVTMTLNEKSQQSHNQFNHHFGTSNSSESTIKCSTTQTKHNANLFLYANLYI